MQSLTDNKKYSLDDVPSVVFADEKGNVVDHPYLKMAGRSGFNFIIPEPDELVSLPFGSTLFLMPGRIPIGWDEAKDDFVPYKSKYFAVGAFLPPGYVRTLLPATQLYENAPTLPLWAYSAVGWKDGKFWATGIMVDPNPHWDPKFFQDDEGLADLVKTTLKRNPQNRLLHHLAKCALEYHCFAAKNCFYKRWELPLPTSPICNARCIGCLSGQPPELCRAPHERIRFIPTVDEICEITLPHLEEAEDAIASFGQGCEGEPILQGKTLISAVERLRSSTSRGIINLNTNGSRPEVIAQLSKKGLDTIRVTINTLDERLFMEYHKPKDFSIKQIKRSLISAKENGSLTAINLLVFPGVTDREAERDRAISFIKETYIDQIQMRNLNIDPDLYLNIVGENGPRYNLEKWMRDLREIYPDLSFNYFNRAERER